MKTKITPRHPLAALAVLAMVLFSGMANAAGKGVITQTATGSFEATVTKRAAQVTATTIQR